MKQLFLLVGGYLIHSTLIYAQQGNVGINTINPQATLHIAGNVRIDSLPAISSEKILVANSTGDVGFIDKDSLFPDMEKEDLDFEYGEDISSGDIVAIGDGISGYLTIDQAVSNTNTSFPVTTFFGQIFKTSSVATGIRAVACRVTSSETTFTVRLRKVQSGAPVGLDLGAVSYYYQSPGNGLFTFVFNPPISVNPNEMYVFYVQAVKSSGLPSNYYHSTANVYLDGDYVQTNDNGITWQSNQNQDLVFRIYETQTQQGKLYRAVAKNGALSQFATSFLISGSTTFANADKTTSVVGFAKDSGVKGSVGSVAVGGMYHAPNSVFTAGVHYWLGTTAGTILQYPVVPERKIGFAISSNRLLLQR